MISLLSDKQAAVIAGVVLVGGYLAYRNYGAAVVEAVNPTSQNNLANRGFNGLYQWATGSDGTLGTDLAGWVHDDAAAVTASPGASGGW